MKKLLSIVLAFAMLLSVVGVSAAEPVAEKYNGTQIVNVTGKVTDGSYVTLLLLDANDNVKHIQEVKPESNGSYRAKFKFSETTEGLSLKVKQGNADVTDSVIDATLTKEDALTYTFGASTLKDSTLAVAEFENYFNIEGETYVILIAFYAEDGSLISVSTNDETEIGFDGTSETKTLDIPENTATVKAFMWDSIEKMIPLANEKTTRPATEINILAIGNSFTDDPTWYLDNIAAAEGVELNITKAIHGGSTIWQHWYYAANDLGFYGSQTVDGSVKTQNNKNNTGEWTYTLKEYLDPDNKTVNKSSTGYYDIITFQQLSGSSGKIETYGFEEDTAGTYENCATELAKIIRTYQPNAEIVLQQTWSYEQGYSQLASYSEDGTSTDLAAQTRMYNAIVDTVKTACERLAEVYTDDGKPISLDGKPLRYIPTGDAFQNARENESFQTVRDEAKMYTASSGSKFLDESLYVSLHRDGYHSSHLYGRYLGALVWYGALTGNSPVATKYSHSYSAPQGTLTPDEELVSVIKNAAEDALSAYGRWSE